MTNVNNAEKIVPYHSSENKTTQIERMFDDIAGNYDTLNHTLSVGIDKYWRKKGIHALKSSAPQIILDVATGTGDLAIEINRLLHPQEIIGIDISREMIRLAEEKVKKNELSAIIRFQKEDSQQLTFSDNSFDAATVAFGVRNFENLEEGLREILRVLKPTGKLMILELTTPTYFPMKQLYKFYSQIIIPAVGRIISRNKVAYNYLPASIAAFPQGEKMQEILQKSGYINTSFKRLTFGICTMYIGEKRALE